MSRIKQSVTVSLSPYVLEKMEKYTGKGKKFSTTSDAVNTALVEIFYRMETLELAASIEKIEEMGKAREETDKENKRRAF